MKNEVKCFTGGSNQQPFSYQSWALTFKLHQLRQSVLSYVLNALKSAFKDIEISWGEELLSEAR